MYALPPINLISQGLLSTASNTPYTFESTYQIPFSYH